MANKTNPFEISSLLILLLISTLVSVKYFQRTKLKFVSESFNRLLHILISLLLDSIELFKNLRPITLKIKLKMNHSDKN